MRRQTTTDLIPSDWDADEAFAVYALLREITDIVWERYRAQIIDSLRPHCALDERQQRNDPVALPWADEEDSIPF